METAQSFIFRLFILISLFAHPAFGQERLQTVAALSSDLEEISGIVKGQDDTFLAINDSGNSNEIFVLNAKGEIIKRVKVTNAENKDWEAITKDQNGFVYIGDIGNNNNKRQDLVIYKIRAADIYNNTEVLASKIGFTYKDQKAFPPDASQKNYDAEALIVRYDRIYVFTKNRTNPYSGYTYLYKIPNRVGKHIVSRYDSLYMGNTPGQSWITDATLSKDVRHLVLLSQDRLWLISDFNRDQLLKGYIQEIELNSFTQKESVCFKNDSILVLADEDSNLSKGELYALNVAPEISLIDSLRKKEVTLLSKEFGDSLLISINSVVGADVFYEFFNGNMKRVDFARIDFFEPGEHSFYIKPKNMINGSYMLNIKVGNRPHGFFVNRFKEVDWDELYRVRDSIQSNR
jgi:hypothetical protein